MITELVTPKPTWPSLLWKLVKWIAMLAFLIVCFGVGVGGLIIIPIALTMNLLDHWNAVEYFYHIGCCSFLAVSATVAAVRWLND